MMFAKRTTAPLAHAQISAVLHEGLTITLPDGRKGKLAIIDDAGNVVEAGDAVAGNTWNCVVDTVSNMLRGMGHLRTFTGPRPTMAEAA